MLYCQFNANGAGNKVARFRSNRKIGRIDFQIRNLGSEAVTLALYETNAEGVSEVKVGSDLSLAAGGINTISAASSKPLLIVRTATGNTGASLVQIDAMFLGRPLYGQATLDENLPNNGFSGSNLNGDPGDVD